MGGTGGDGGSGPGGLFLPKVSGKTMARITPMMSTPIPTNFSVFLFFWKKVYSPPRFTSVAAADLSLLFIFWSEVTDRLT